MLMGLFDQLSLLAQLSYNHELENSGRHGRTMIQVITQASLTKCSLIQLLRV